MAKKVRNANIEWLRIISMLMIVMLHTLGKGNLLRSMSGVGGINVYIAWLLESCSIVAVNIFFLISGYVLIDSEFKTKRIFSIIMQTVFYGIIIYLMYLRTGMDMEGAKNSFLLAALPIHMKTYWFLTVYTVMYMMLPFIAVGIRALTQKQHMALIIIFVVFNCVFKSVLPVKLDIDGAAGGYNIEWFVTLFLIAAYIKRYGFKKLNKASYGLILYFVSVLLIFGEQLFLDAMLNKTGRFTYIQEISYSYNHIFVLFASLGLFAWGLNKKQPGKIMAGIGNTIAPMTLGVYIIHEHSLIRYEWPNWFKVSSFMDKNVVLFVLSVVGVVLAVYMIGTLIDAVRLMIFKIVDYLLGKSAIVKGFNKLDDIVNGRMD